MQVAPIYSYRHTPQNAYERLRYRSQLSHNHHVSCRCECLLSIFTSNYNLTGLTFIQPRWTVSTLPVTPGNTPVASPTAHRKAARDGRALDQRQGIIQDLPVASDRSRSRIRIWSMWVEIAWPSPAPESFVCWLWQHGKFSFLLLLSDAVSNSNSPLSLRGASTARVPHQ